MMIRPRAKADGTTTYELRVKHKLLPKPFYSSFNTQAEATNYGIQLEALLAQGLVPKDLAVQRSRERGPVATLLKIEREYRQAVAVSPLDAEILARIVRWFGTDPIDRVLTFAWAEKFIRSLKLNRNLAPGTIRKYVGAVARMLDWHIKRSTKPNELPVANPLRMLPANYSIYNEHEVEALSTDPTKRAKRDVERDRRLNGAQEEERIIAVMSGKKRDDRERPLEMSDRQDMIDLYQLIVNTGLRLREAYRQTTTTVDLPLNTIRVELSKTGKKREIPIPPVVRPMLERRVAAAGKGRPIFPWWDGETDNQALAKITAMLSKRFSRVFEYARCEGLTEHDLRHEATCRWMLMKDARGDWLFRPEEVMRITGHTNLRTFLRYLSLRGSDLAARMYV